MYVCVCIQLTELVRSKLKLFQRDHISLHKGEFLNTNNKVFAVPHRIALINP